MTTPIRFTLAALLAATMLPAAAERAPGAQLQKVSRGDARFFVKAAEAGLGEVELSKLALQKAENADVRALARRMVDDHTRSNQKLMELASNRGVALPEGPTRSQRKALSELQEKNGRDFDRRYLEVLMEDHDEAVDLFEDAARDARDPQVRAFAADTLPTLRRHHELVAGLEERAG